MGRLPKNQTNETDFSISEESLIYLLKKLLL